MAQKPGRGKLGKGLSVLMSDTPLSSLVGSDEDAKPIPQKNIQTLFVHQLAPGRNQPRQHFDEEALKALADSLTAQGLLQPILVREDPEEKGKYEIIAGERRWRAAQLARFHEVPVVVRDFDDETALEVGLVENVQRQDLSPIEEALGYERLTQEFGHSQEALAKTLGKSRVHIANTLRLLKLSSKIQTLVDQKQISAGHARALIGVENAENLAERIVRDELSVRAVEDLVRAYKSPSKVKSKSQNHSLLESAEKDKDPNTRDLEDRLSLYLGLSVEIREKGLKGEVVLHYQNLEQLDYLLKKLSNNDA